MVRTPEGSILYRTKIDRIIKAMNDTGLQLLHPTDWQNMLLRLSVATLAGSILGWERELGDKPAGLRTHMLVSLGAALFIMVGIQTGMVQDNADTLSRIMQGVITGIGFLGAGEIVRSPKRDSASIQIRGLTTAASIWVATALGLAAGCGLWLMSAIGVGLAVFILQGVKRLEARIRRR